MSNSWFQFREFTVHQDRCAMKVSTDACIQGAWTPVYDNVKQVLDIGAGTGLLSLMVAQRSLGVTIDAVELDADAALQAAENAAASPWSNRINVLHKDILDMQPAHKYDLVICNPPFFNDSLLGDDAGRNKVRHTLSLTHRHLFGVIDNVLAHSGYASVLLPVAEHANWQKLVAASGWIIFNKLDIIPKRGSAPNRVVSLCCREGAYAPIPGASMVIRDGNDYTEDFKQLNRPYYLNL